MNHWLLAAAAHGYFYNEVHWGSRIEWIKGHTVEGQAPPALIGAWPISEAEYLQRIEIQKKDSGT